MKLRLRFFSGLLLLVLLFALPGSFSGSQASPASQADPARQKAQTMLQKLTPEEKVGQLFLVTLSGTTL